MPWFKKTSDPDRSPGEATVGPSSPSLEPLREDEVAWVASTIAELTEQGVRTNDIDDLGRYYDEMLAGWHRLREADRPDPHEVTTRVGLALGQYVADRTGLEWRVAIGAHGTVVALHRERDDVLVYPTELVAQHWRAREDRVLPGLARSLVDSFGEPIA